MKKLKVNYNSGPGNRMMGPLDGTGMMPFKQDKLFDNEPFPNNNMNNNRKFGGFMDNNNN